MTYYIYIYLWQRALPPHAMHAVLVCLFDLSSPQVLQRVQHGLESRLLRGIDSSHAVNGTLSSCTRRSAVDASPVAAVNGTPNYHGVHAMDGTPVNSMGGASLVASHLPSLSPSKSPAPPSAGATRPDSLPPSSAGGVWGYRGLASAGASDHHYDTEAGPSGWAGTTPRTSELELSRISGEEGGGEEEDSLLSYLVAGEGSTFHS